MTKHRIRGPGLHGRAAGRAPAAGQSRYRAPTAPGPRPRALIEQGLIWRDTPREVAAGAEVVFSMVTDDAALAAITSGPDGILAGLRPGAVYVDMSTVSPRASRELARRVHCGRRHHDRCPRLRQRPRGRERHAHDHGRRPRRGVRQGRAAAAPAGRQRHPRGRERPGPAAQAGDQHQPRRTDDGLQRRAAAGRARRDRPSAGRPCDDRIRDRVTHAAGARPARPRPARSGMVRCATDAQRHPPRAGGGRRVQGSASRGLGRGPHAEPGRGIGLRAPRHRRALPGAEPDGGTGGRGRAGQTGDRPAGQPGERGGGPHRANRRPTSRAARRTRADARRREHRAGAATDVAVAAPEAA